MLLLRIERYLRARKMAPTRFGRNAIGDPWLVPHMRNGRTLRDRTAARVSAYLDRVEVEQPAGLPANKARSNARVDPIQRHEC